MGVREGESIMKFPRLLRDAQLLFKSARREDVIIHRHRP